MAWVWKLLLLNNFYCQFFWRLASVLPLTFVLLLILANIYLNLVYCFRFKGENSASSENDIYIAGFSDQILR